MFVLPTLRDVRKTCVEDVDDTVGHESFRLLPPVAESSTAIICAVTSPFFSHADASIQALLVVNVLALVYLLAPVAPLVNSNACTPLPPVRSSATPAIVPLVALHPVGGFPVSMSPLANNSLPRPGVFVHAVPDSAQVPLCAQVAGGVFSSKCRKTGSMLVNVGESKPKLHVGRCRKCGRRGGDESGVKRCTACRANDAG